MIDLSIILPTCNRAEHLARSLAALEVGVRRSIEIIVVDGASTDDTPAVLRAAGDRLGMGLKVIREHRREGFVRAANKGFHAASGRMMTWLNDDARPQPGALDRAIDLLESSPNDVAFAALFHGWRSPKNVAFEDHFAGRAYQLCHVRGTLYANFCVGLRQTYERLGWFDERYFFYAADPDLSLKAWQAGYRVVPAFGCRIDHDEHADDRREADAARGAEDNQKLFAKWKLPPKNQERNDFDPLRPCAVVGWTRRICA